MYVATNLLSRQILNMFVATSILLSREKTCLSRPKYACRDNNKKDVFCLANDSNQDIHGEII